MAVSCNDNLNVNFSAELYMHTLSPQKKLLTGAIVCIGGGSWSHGGARRLTVGLRGDVSDA